MEPTFRKGYCALTSFEALDFVLASSCYLANNLAKAHISSVAKTALGRSPPFDSTEHLLVQCRHHAQVLLLMHELTPLLLPPAPEVLQTAGLQCFKQYFDITSEALKALQTEAVTAQAKEPGGSVKAGANCFDWTALDAASAGVLTLAGRLCQQVAPDVSSQARICTKPEGMSEHHDI